MSFQIVDVKEILLKMPGGVDIVNDIEMNPAQSKKNTLVNILVADLLEDWGKFADINHKL